MKKLKYFFASAIVLVAVAISTIVFAEYKEQKGDLRVGNTISNKNVSVNAGSSNLIIDGDVKVVKTVSKTDTEGVYNVKFDISAKEKENEKTTPIYAVVVFDNSGSMICDSAKGSYAYSKADAERMTRNYNYNHNKRENLDYYFEEYKSALGDNTSVYCTKYTEERIGWFDTKLVKIEGDVVLNNKWESAVKGTKSFTNEILSIDSSKISYVPFASSAQTASKWYINGDIIPSSVYSHPVGGTNLSDAINKAYNKLNDGTIDKNAKKIIMVISDGEPDSSDEAYNSANTAKGDGIKIYTIGYSVAKDSTAATVLNNISSNSTNDKTNYSFLAGQDNVSDIFKKLATDITTVYAKNATLTDTIGGNFKFTSSNDNVKVNGQNVSFSIDKLTRQSQSFSFNITIDDENITEDGWYPTNDGFNLTYTDVYGNSQKITSSEDPEVYWVAKRYDYKIEYYYDEQIDNTLTKTGKDVKGKEITVSEESIKNNTKEGYSLISVNPNTRKIVISSSEENVIRVYYERNSYDYEVHYFFNGNEDESLIERKSAKFNDVISTYTDKVKTGYKLDRVENLPLTIKTKGNVINVYYVTDETQTKELSYTVEYYKDGKKVDNDTQVINETKQVLESDTLTVEKGEINVTNKYVGYKFEKTNPETIPNSIEDKGVIKVYYVKDMFEYTINYYYNGKIDNSKTESSKAKYETVISTYPDKKEVGYKLEKTENLPLTVTEDKTKNVINVYYVTDENQTKELSYTVEYYKDGNKVANDTQVVKQTKQVLESDTLTVEKGEINVTNKYVGYKFEKTNPETIPNSIENKGVVKVYYVTDENQTKELSYTVEYYKDGKKVANDTQVVKETKQVLESDTLTVEKGEINVTDKYVGYSFVKTEPSTIPNSIEDKGIIRVYYERNSYDYEVHYFFNGNEDESLIERKSAKYNDVINTYTDKVKTGYKLQKVENLPLTIGVENNIINVYYVTDNTQTKELSYTVEYYKDGNKVANDTQVVKQTKQVLESDTLTVEKGKINVTDKYVGYKFEKTNPETIPDSIEDKGVIKVYYVFDKTQTKELSYTVEYYKNGKKVENDTQVEVATVHVLEPNTLQVNQDKINTENKYVGYKLEKTNPETIPSEINNGGIIKVYYILDDGQTKTLTYTVNYYKDGNLVKEDTETIYETKQVLESDILTVKSKEINIKDKYVGYKFVKTNPELIPEVIENKGVIDVYYEKDTFTYEVRYYFNRELDESLTEKSVALYGDKITSYTDKVKEDYTLETVENLPLVISEDESKNIINVYYKIDGQGVIEPIEPPHTSANNSIYALILLVNALGASVLLKKREN